LDGDSVTAQPDQPNELIAAAREWYDAGYCVVPTHEDQGKRPFGQWKAYQSERPTWEQVEAWLESGRYTGIGVILGEVSGNTEAIEIEGPMSLAVERLNAVIAESQKYAEIGLPDLLARVARGCVEQSAGGGLHLFIRVTDGPAKGNAKLAMIGQGKDRKVVSETRGSGGFMVVAPTPGRNGHPEGASYIFINGGHPSKTVEVTAEERDLLHEVFRLALDEDDEAEVAAMLVQAEHKVNNDYDGVSAFDDYRHRVSWREILEPAGWTWSHRDADRDYWVRPGKKVADGHSASTIEDGPMVVFSTTVGWPTEQGLSKGHVYSLLHHDGDLSAAARQLTQDGYGTVPSITELPPWEAVLDPDATEEEKSEAEVSWVEENLPRVNWHELWADEREEEWIVEPLLAARRLVALYSAPKVGKSLLMLEIAAAIANGRPMFGYPPSGRTYRTLYVDFENDPRSDVRERLEAMGYGPDDLDNLVLLSFPTMSFLDTERGSLELLAAVRYYGIHVVVIDTVSRTIGGEENANDSWLKWYKYTGLKLKQERVALIRLDHSGKDETKGQRGASAKSGDVDAVWRLTRTGDDTFDLVCEANRFPIHEPLVALKRITDDGVLRHEPMGNSRRAMLDEILRKMAEAGVPRDEKLRVNAVRKMLRDANVKFVNEQVSKYAIEMYARRLPEWGQPAVDDE
jgi:hypothetical protein